MKLSAFCFAVLLVIGSGTSRTTQAADFGPNAKSSPQAGQTARAGLKPLDIELKPTGLLTGTVLDPQGSPLAARQIQLLSGAKPLVTATTNEQGQFAIRGVQPGIYSIATGTDVAVFRVWAPNTAPPAARPQAVLYSGMVARGLGDKFGSWLPSINPWQMLHSPTTVGVAIGMALAIPIAIHDEERGS